MYHEHFGLREAPFALCTDPRFLYLSPAHARARAYLDYAVYKGDGIVVITGEIGAGKSMLIHDITAREHGHADVIAIRQPQADTVGFLQSLLIDCGRRDPPALRAALIAAVEEELAQRFMWGRRTTLIVDEAQKLGRDVLETLRMLADRQVGADKPLSIVLLGQPCLRERLAGADMEQFRQRVRLAYHLDGLNAAETDAYIHRRLVVAGAPNGARRVVLAAAVQRIHRYTGGVPRLINVLTDMALTAACLDGARQVTVTQVDNAIDELGWVSFRSRRRRAALALPRASLPQRLGRHLAHGLDVGTQMATVAGGRLVAVARRARRRAGPLAQRARAWVTGRMPASIKKWVRRAARRSGPVLARVSDRLGPHAGRWLAWTRDNRPAVGAAAAGSASFIAIIALFSLLFDRDAGDDLAVEPVLRVAGDRVEATIVLTADTPATGRTDYLMHWAPPPTPRGAGWLTVQPPDATLSEAAAAYFDAFVPAWDETTRAGLEPLPGLMNAQWLLAQDPDGYVIQVLAARKRDVVHRFLSGQAGGLNLAWYHRVRDAEDWYVLVSNVYPDYQSAKLASTLLPATVRKTQPWIRPLSKVQEDIRAALDARPSLAAL